MNKVNKIKKGATLIEIIISISIVVTLSTTIFVSFVGREAEIRLSLFRHQFINDLRFTQVKSVNSVNNFGIFVQSANRYILFEDRDGNNLAGAGEEIEHVTLPEEIIFTPPSIGRNIVFQKSGSLPLGAADINISITDNINTKSILINSLGLIN